MTLSVAIALPGAAHIMRHDGRSWRGRGLYAASVACAQLMIRGHVELSTAAHTQRRMLRQSISSVPGHGEADAGPVQQASYGPGSGQRRRQSLGTGR